MAPTHELWQRLSFDGALCTVRFIGEVAGTRGSWLGVEWDDPSRGKHDGCHKGVRYFECLSRSPTAASFVRPTRPSDPHQAFAAAAFEKYGSEAAATGPAPKEIVISGKVAEEVGFDKVRRQLARLNELRVVILDGARIDTAGLWQGKTVRETCPRITELDLSRNLISTVATVAEICSQLDELRSVKLNGNRLHGVLEDPSLDASQPSVFCRTSELGLEETLLSWEEICHIVSQFRALTSLSCGTNQLRCLPPRLPLPPTLITSLTSLNLEYNEFTAVSDLASLTGLASLRNLHLKGNNISSLTRDASAPVPVFGPNLRHLDISYNNVASWSFVDALPGCFPGLVSLRLAHNPVYDVSPVDQASVGAKQPAEAAAAGANDDPFIVTVARLARLEHLNFSAITPAERLNAEMFYLFRIGRQLSAVPEGSEAAVLANHQRYVELCSLYGEPVISRKRDVGQSFLEGRVITVYFQLHWPEEDDTDDAPVAAPGSGVGIRPIIARRVEIPRSLDIYAVKGVAGRLFGVSPLELRLVWETGDWDPVATVDAQDSSDNGRNGDEDASQPWRTAAVTSGSTERPLIRRMIELRDSPRQFGYCVDGPEATVRVERRL